MNFSEIISVIVIVLVVGAAVAYIIKAKKSGKKCIGCPYAKQCNGNCGASAKKSDADKKDG